MSIHIIRCKNCGIDRHALDAVTCQVNLTKSNHCGSCHKSHEDKFTYHFCSPACMMTWMAGHGQEFLKDVAKFRAGKMYDRNFDPPPDSGMNAYVSPWPDPVLAENAHPPKIHVPPIDPEKVAEELKRRAEDVKKELKSIEEMKKVSPELWTRVIGSTLKKPEDFFTNPKQSKLMEEWKAKVLEENPCTTHCCTTHGCKYGHDEECPVCLGLCPSNDCEQCGLEREGYYGEVFRDDSD